MAQVDSRPSERLVALNGRWFRDEAVDAMRTFVAPFVAAARAMERASRPRADGAAPLRDAGRDRTA